MRTGLHAPLGTTRNLSENLRFDVHTFSDYPVLCMLSQQCTAVGGGLLYELESEHAYCTPRRLPHCTTASTMTTISEDSCQRCQRQCWRV